MILMFSSKEVSRKITPPKTIQNNMSQCVHVIPSQYIKSETEHMYISVYIMSSDLQF